LTISQRVMARAEVFAIDLLQGPTAEVPSALVGRALAALVPQLSEVQAQGVIDAVSASETEHVPHHYCDRCSAIVHCIMSGNQWVGYAHRCEECGVIIYELSNLDPDRSLRILAGLKWGAP